jgi:Tfp pilus assembly protein PilV
MPRSAVTSVLRRLRREDEGSILMEALAAAVVLIIIALALLGSLDTAAKGSSRLKARAAANALAEQDLERMRSIAVTRLSNYHEERDVTSGDATYHIASRAEWIRDAAGSTQSCTSDDTQAEYLRITSTVTSAVIGKDTRPVTQSSLVAPPVAAFGPDQGTLAVKVVDRDAKPVQNATVRATPSSGGSTMADATNSAGCAIFAYVAVGNYDIEVQAPGYVDPDGDAIATQDGVAVTEGKVNLTEQSFDLAGFVTFGFSARDPLSGQIKPSRGWSAMVGMSAFARAYTGAAFTAEPVASVVPIAAYPYTDPYTFYAGDCQGNDPTKAPTNDADWFTADAPGQTEKVDRRQALPMTLNVPSFKVRVNGSSPVITVREVTGTPAGTTPSCGASQKLGTSATWSVARAADNNWYVTKTWSQSQSPAFFDTGLPFGTCTVCASAGGKYATATLNLTSLTAPATATLNPGSGPNGTCS